MKTPQSWVDSYQDFWITGELGLIKAGPSLDRWIEAIQTDARSDLLDRIKVLEGEVAKWEEHARLLRVQIEVGNSAFNHKFKECVEITLLLHRCLNTGLRDDKHRPLYLQVCRVIGVDPDKPWEEK